MFNSDNKSFKNQNEFDIIDVKARENMTKTTENSRRAITKRYSQYIPFRPQFDTEADEGIVRHPSEVRLPRDRDIESYGSKNVSF